jgi:hypothetical protein
VIRFTAPLEAAPRGGAYVTIPSEVVADLGGGGRIPVRVSFDGVEYRGSVVRMSGGSVLGVLKEIRTGLGKEIGDNIQISIERDTGEREVEVPPELAAALALSPAASKAFESLSYSHRREHAMHVAEAKQAATRVRRAQKTVEMLLA